MDRALGRAVALSCLAGLAAPVGLAARDLDGAIGKAVFDRLWVAAPASTESADGLGPLYAARSCSGCHAQGGRTSFRLGRDDPATSPGLVIRLGNAAGAPDATYGAQLQPEAAGDMAGEGRASVSFSTSRSGPPKRPQWRVEGWAYGKPDAGTRPSPRVAPSLAGVGLLARVSDEEILSREDPDDRDRDGVSGRAARVEGGIGRFGWKAAEPSLQSQVAAAFALDMGLSTQDRPAQAGDCTASQSACLAAPHGAAGDDAEVRPELVAALVAFLERRPPHERPNRTVGAALFASTGCAACHAPSLRLDGGGEARAFTDLLLHDMGDGLDDGASEGAARPGEWRTAPLWGLSRTLAQGSGLMHDGRAADVSEAVGWHGGEGAGARSRFRALAPQERAALVAYVNGL